MAYMNQEKKRKIAAELKKAIPSDWKYSLGVDNHSTIVLTIQSAPVDLLSSIEDSDSNHDRTYLQLNHYYPQNRYEGAVLQTMRAIIKALNLDNYDRSDSMTDYFDVGHYVNINIGRWNKPFVFTGAKVSEAA